MNDHEKKLVDESIAAYKRTIEYIKSQIHQLELKKLKAYEDDCPQCFKFKIAPKKER